MQFRQYKTSWLGVPRGKSAIFNILCNIYLHPLDLWITEKITTFSGGGRETGINPVWRNLSGKLLMSMTRGNISEARRLEGRRTRIPARIVRNDKCLGGFPSGEAAIYVRYADDFLIAFSRTSTLEAVRFKDELGEYLEQTLSFHFREDNSKMTNLNREKALFLGTYVSCAPASWVYHRWHSTGGDRKNTLCAGIRKRVRSKLRSPCACSWKSNRTASIGVRLGVPDARRTNHQVLWVLGSWAQHDRSPAPPAPASDPAV